MTLPEGVFAKAIFILKQKLLRNLDAGDLLRNYSLTRYA
jgi:hypothetical protein